VTEDLFIVRAECELVKCDPERVSMLPGRW
jgi:hypothetical protein